MVRILFFGALILNLVSLRAQDSSLAENHLIGWNAVSLASDGVNFFGKTRLHDRFYLGFELGYQYGPGWTFVAIDDDAENYQLEGGFFKVNPLYVFRSITNNRLQVGPVYIGSFYNESAEYDQGSSGQSITESEEGFAHGFGIHVSVDIFLIKPHLGIRLGMQKAYTFRDDYVRSSALTYEPGAGAVMPGLSHQGFLGVFYSWD